MSRSTVEFSRWQPLQGTTWIYQVYKKYSIELRSIIGAHRATMFYAFKNLGTSGANMDDDFVQHFVKNNHGPADFRTLREWSEAINNFDNWVNLSNIATIASNLETYLASVIALAIESDPSVLIGAPARSIDGAYVLKHRPGRNPRIEDHVIACTKGDWSSRLSSMERLFGILPPLILQKHSDLERIRKIRNRFGHAFGRDIEISREHGNIHIAPMETISRTTVAKLASQVNDFVRGMDKFLLNNHIGDYEVVNFYAKMFPDQHSHVPPGQRAANLKKEIGRFGANNRGKLYCNGVVKYWEGL